MILGIQIVKSPKLEGSSHINHDCNESYVDQVDYMVGDANNGKSKCTGGGVKHLTKTIL